MNLKQEVFMKYFIVSIALFCIIFAFSNCSKEEENQRIIISDEIEVIRLSKNAYVHISSLEVHPWGKVDTNGLIFVDGNEAFLFDTPWNDEQTEILVNWINDSLKAKVTTFVAGHWHGDNIGGLNYLHSIGVKSYANHLTNYFAELNEMPVPMNAFIDNLELNLNGKNVNCHYFGGAHSADNIVIWIPSEEILFGGCMIRDINSTGLGNTSDAEIDQWLPTIEKVIENFPNAKIVIPGHGQIGGIELLEHTKTQVINYLQ